MSSRASRALANALRSTLWLISYYTNMNGPGPALRDLKLAIGRAIAELEAEATIELSGESHLCEREPTFSPVWIGFAKKTAVQPPSTKIVLCPCRLSGHTKKKPRPQWTGLFKNREIGTRR